MSHFYIVNGKKVNLIKHKWDYLIILDACRYDYFKKVYRKYIKEGTLKKAITPSNWTVTWLKNIWREK